ncbi:MULTISPECIES: S1 family peptidase [unclassified Amycolatopsis]|uniref:S1 family peptidase n=1 Tax=unclassified Amycolatopsis TaxID=2618356 RepID=UPI0028766045|nr:MULTISPECIES: S1 family peptidase [unclassified Amycolatopsis]MDS0138716.1 S1 family peptidase [Amycolatopsis sp. 505]MDS0147210.1 S1 family peptidase [Amycolatopsis sp. CM201R]
MRSRHRKISRGKILAAAAAVLAAGTAAIALPQANAAGGDASAMASASAITGTAWAVDERTGETVVTADSTVQGAKWDSLLAATRGKAVRVERTPGVLSLFAEGGDAIFAGGARCSLGFNVTTNSGPGILTAGHCAAAGRRWSLTQGGRPVATLKQSTFPGNGDFALLTYDNAATNAPSVVDTGGGRTVAIARAAAAAINQQVSRMGSTTGLHSGRVTALDATVNYPEGRVTGLIQTTVCAEPGDSGGSLFSTDGSAIGITSGGSGDCRTGGVTFFQPVTTALAAVGARIGG